MYMGYVSVLEGALSLRSGLALDDYMDTIEVNREQLWLFAKRLLDRLAEEGDSVFADQLRIVFRPAVVMAERAGVSITPESPREAELLDEARALDDRLED